MALTKQVELAHLTAGSSQTKLDKDLLLLFVRTHHNKFHLVPQVRLSHHLPKGLKP